MNIVTRAESGLRPATKLIMTTWDRRDEVVYHYSGGPESQSWRAIQDWCFTKGHSDIDYNCGIDMSDGRLFEGREGIWLSVGSHNLNRNTRGIGVCFIGEQGTPLSMAAKHTALWVLGEARRLKAAAGAGGGLVERVHSDHQPTSCPGDIVREWVKAGMPVVGAPPSGGEITLYANFGDENDQVKEMQGDLIEAGFDVGPSGDDGEYGPATAAGVAAMMGGGDGRRYGATERRRLQLLLRARAAGGVTAEQVRQMIESTRLTPA